MNDIEERYDIETAAAWILGHARRTGIPTLPESVIQKTAEKCSEEEMQQIVTVGQAAGLPLYPFKSGTQMLARTRRTLGFLHAISFETMLDIGSGRGVFLIPFMKEFPGVQVTSLDLLEKRVTFLNELAEGGFGQLHAEQRNICDQPFPDDSFDIVTMLEVLEHIPEVEKAVECAVKMARQFVVVTVPSKPDNNPEHVHLLTKKKLTELFNKAGCTRLHFDGVEGHLFLTAATGEKRK
jgi:2-polyprenyl-3-methyl-5-hydroxy-6-metoxy-1,4-benzoquinol methylase